jgi:hypothetical protein
VNLSKSIEKQLQPKELSQLMKLQWRAHGLGCKILDKIKLIQPLMVMQLFVKYLVGFLIDKH